MITPMMMRKKAKASSRMPSWVLTKQPGQPDAVRLSWSVLVGSRRAKVENSGYASEALDLERSYDLGAGCVGGQPT